MWIRTKFGLVNSANLIDVEYPPPGQPCQAAARGYDKSAPGGVGIIVLSDAATEAEARAVVDRIWQALRCGQYTLDLTR